MPAFTVQQLIDRAAAIADMDGNFVRPEQWLAWYNVEVRALELFIARNGYVTNLAETADNDSLYTIPISDSTLAILGVFEVRDGRYRALRFSNQVDMARGLVNGDAQEYMAVMGDLDDGLVIDLFPKPTSGTYRALYLEGSAPAEALDDAANWPLGWEERLVLGMARKALVKEESDTRKIEQMMVEQDTIIEEFCWSRSLASAPQVRNVDRVQRGWSDTMPFGSYESWLWV